MPELSGVQPGLWCLPLQALSPGPQYSGAHQTLEYSMFEHSTFEYLMSWVQQACRVKAKRQAGWFCGAAFWRQV